MLLLEEIVDCVIFTLSIICFIIQNKAATLSSITRILFSSGLFVMSCKSVHLVQKSGSYQSYSTGIGMQRLFCTVIYLLICRHEQTFDFFIVKTKDLFSPLFYARMAHTFKVIGRRPHKIFLGANCSKLVFLQTQKCFPSVLPKRIYEVFLRLHSKSAQRKRAKHNMTSRD